MKNEKKYTVNTVQYITGTATAFFLTAVAVYNTVSGNYWTSAVFIMLGIVFYGVGAVNGMKIRIKENRIEQLVFGRTVRGYDKKEILEIGVAGLRLFGKFKGKGIKYIYISKQKMNDAERFQMCLKWPPRDKMYMTWNKKRLEDIQQFWQGEIERYNTEDIMF